jgi:diguanylate cyclase (GGDEF)-like protein
MTKSAEAVQQLATPVSLPPSHGLQRERPLVLVVEDDLSTREALVDYLQPHLEVIWAADGEAALMQARDHSPDVIVMDLSMPKRDGMSALQELHKDMRTRGMPVIFVSSSGDERTRVRCLELGADDFVAKPAGGRELLARIERTLRHAKERQELQALAQLDGLTGLYNFRAMYERLEAELARAHRYGHPLALIMLDLDHLKAVNDQFGHEAGNAAIRLLARQLRLELREVDFAARYGGDEFVILLPHQTDAEAVILAERLRVSLLKAPLHTPDGPRHLTMSIGIAAHRDSVVYDDAAALLDAADGALYDAKRRGRDRICCAAPGPLVSPETPVVVHPG